MKQIKQTIFLCLLWMIGIGVHAEEIPNNEIWYTSSNGKVVKPNISYAFDASIISNTYSNGKGVIKFDNSVTSIGGLAFYYCSGLTSITIPNSVRSIGERAFYECSGLTSITIPNSVKSIGDEAFYYCSGLTSIDIPNSVTSIGNFTFCGCSGLSSITIPNSVTSIGDRVFSNCSGLTSINIPNSVTSIGSYAFYGCYFSSFVNNSSLDAESNNYWGAKICNNDGLVIEDNIIVGCAKWVTSINIPNSVTSIGKSAFSGCSNLTSITIPNSVTSIGDEAFWMCSGLTSITIPNSVRSIGKSAFYGCSSLTSITIPNSVTSIGEYAFYKCSGLTSINIPNSVTSIGDGAFLYCYFSSFVNNSSLDAESNNYWGAKICNNDGLVIEDNIIVDCAKWVTSINIPNSVTSIGDEAFLGCSSLTSITIPNSVTSIGWGAFNGCTGLISIKVSWSRPLSIPTKTFEYIDKTNCILYVPKGTSTMYMVAPGWIDFVNIQEYADDEDETHYITIKQGDGGAVRQVVELGKTYLYQFVPTEGWSINTATFNGSDITGLLNNGLFTTPVITGDSEISVVFSKSTDIKSTPSNSDIKVYASSNTITISGVSANEPVSVYDTNGVRVAFGTGNGNIQVNGNGVYFVKAEGQTFKVCM